MSSEQAPLTMTKEREAYIRSHPHWHNTELEAEIDALRAELQDVTADRDSWREQSRTHNIELQKTKDALASTTSAQGYKSAINGCLAAVIKENPTLDHEWGGDRTGWGFVFEWIKWVGNRAVVAKQQLAQSEKTIEGYKRSVALLQVQAEGQCEREQAEYQRGKRESEKVAEKLAGYFHQVADCCDLNRCMGCQNVATSALELYAAHKKGVKP